VNPIDNYDSFTYNLAQYFGELGAEVQVYRNDALTPQDVASLHPSHIIISPGPGDPSDAGISREVIRQLGPEIPILGVCLGHQCIGEVFGGKIGPAPRLMHGKTSLIHHDHDPLFDGVPQPFDAGRYHSLIVEPESIPASLKVIARTADGEVMALRHTRYPIVGVQFHPESILTPHGKQILKNFLTNGSTTRSPATPDTNYATRPVAIGKGLEVGISQSS
jgi:anthranilate synthase/aminodeoxychorismate synthase-like glutamine amidotransferase